MVDIGKMAAAPFTGGASMLIPNPLGGGSGGNLGTDLGQGLGSIEEARANSRIAQGNLALKQGGLANEIYQASLGAKGLENSLDSKNYDSSMKGLLAAHMQDVGVDAPASLNGHLTTFTGGLRPSAIGPEGRALGANMAQFKSSQIGNEGLPAAPAVPDIPQPDFMDSLLNGASAGTGLLGIIGKYLPKNTPVLGSRSNGVGNIGALVPGQDDPMASFWASMGGDN